MHLRVREIGSVAVQLLRFVLIRNKFTSFERVLGYLVLHSFELCR